VVYGGWPREKGERFQRLSRGLFSQSNLAALTELRS
jgi:hypothetical protein